MAYGELNGHVIEIQDGGGRPDGGLCSVSAFSTVITIIDERVGLFQTLTENTSL